MSEPQQPIDAQALVNVLTDQRNSALNALAQTQALLSMRDARIEQLELEVKTLRERPG